jgi:hypothetical protein
MLLASGLLLVGGVVVATFCVRYIRRDTLSDWELLAALVCAAAGFAILFGILIPAITYGSRAYGRVECRNWSHQTGRPYKFVVYTSWDTGQCLTRGSDGRWISKDLLRQFGGSR